MPVLRRPPLEGLTGGLLTLPLAQDTPQRQNEERFSHGSLHYSHPIYSSRLELGSPTYLVSALLASSAGTGIGKNTSPVKVRHCKISTASVSLVQSGHSDLGLPEWEDFLAPEPNFSKFAWPGCPIPKTSLRDLVLPEWLSSLARVV